MSSQALPPARTIPERLSGAEVAFEAAIGWGRAGLALKDNPEDQEAMIEFVSFRRIMEKIQGAMAGATAQGNMMRMRERIEPQTGISPEAPPLPERPRNFQP